MPDDETIEVTAVEGMILDEISLVTRPANQYADVVIHKADRQAGCGKNHRRMKPGNECPDCGYIAKAYDGDGGKTCPECGMEMEDGECECGYVSKAGSGASVCEECGYKGDVGEKKCPECEGKMVPAFMKKKVKKADEIAKAKPGAQPGHKFNGNQWTKVSLRAAGETDDQRKKALGDIASSMKSGKAMELDDKQMWTAMARAKKQGMKVSSNKDGSATITLKDGRKLKIKGKKKKAVAKSDGIVRLADILNRR